jgi:hypothetical protein
MNCSTSTSNAALVKERLAVKASVLDVSVVSEITQMQDI